MICVTVGSPLAPLVFGVSIVAPAGVPAAAQARAAAAVAPIPAPRMNLIIGLVSRRFRKTVSPSRNANLGPSSDCQAFQRLLISRQPQEGLTVKSADSRARRWR